MGWEKILLTIVLIILACKDAECGGLGRILSDSRPPLGLGARFIVGIIAVFIIFANTMLCTFIIRDPNLWSYVSNSHLSMADTPNSKLVFCANVLIPNSPEGEQGDVFHGDR